GYGGGGGGGGGGYAGGPGMGGGGGGGAPLPPGKKKSPAPKAPGLPSADGRLGWPPGFRVPARHSEAGGCQQQVDNLLPTAVAQAGDGQVNQQTVAEINRSLDALTDLLRSRAAHMPANTAAEAERFLQQLSASVKLLK